MSQDRRRVSRWKDPEPDPSDRRRASWQEFRVAYPGILAVLMAAVLFLLAGDMWLLHKRDLYRAETRRLYTGMSDFEREKTDLVLASGEKRMQVMLAMLRRQAGVDEKLHLAVAVDSGRMYLEREGAVLREFPAEMAPERAVGVAPDTVRMPVPRGKRTVEAILGPTDAWDVPEWVWRERSLAPPADRRVPGVLGTVGLVLSGGTVVYALPATGLLADSAYVLPGSVRVPRAHLEAIAANMHPGMAVYFY
jgi:hypothetical protein